MAKEKFDSMLSPVIDSTLGQRCSSIIGYQFSEIVRSLMTNWLGGGSVYMPAIDGKKVPIELSLAVHSDAGYNKDGKSTWGALAICTTNFNDERLNSGISRFTSKDFAKTLLKNLVTDIKAKYGEFGERYLWDRNYSETRLPEVPSAIIETLSHQSFPDMKLAQNPMGKFTIARSLYKSILRYVSPTFWAPTVWAVTLPCVS